MSKDKSKKVKEKKHCRACLIFKLAILAAAAFGVYEAVDTVKSGKEDLREKLHGIIHH